MATLVGMEGLWELAEMLKVHTLPALRFGEMLFAERRGGSHGRVYIRPMCWQPQIAVRF